MPLAKGRGCQPAVAQASVFYSSARRKRYLALPKKNYLPQSECGEQYYNETASPRSGLRPPKVSSRVRRGFAALHPKGEVRRDSAPPNLPY